MIKLKRNSERGQSWWTLLLARNSSDSREQQFIFGCSRKEIRKMRWISLTNSLLRGRIAWSTESNAASGSRGTEIVNLRGWEIQPRSDQKPARFSHVHLSRVLENRRRIVLEDTLDAVFTKLVSLWFPDEDFLTLLVNRYNHRLTPVVRNPFFCPEWSQEFNWVRC